MNMANYKPDAFPNAAGHKEVPVWTGGVGCAPEVVERNPQTVRTRTRLMPP